MRLSDPVFMKITTAAHYELMRGRRAPRRRRSARHN